MNSCSRPARSRARLPAQAACALLAVGLLAGCGQSPGQAGLGYLDAERGIRLGAPLYHLDFPSFPVDSVFATEIPLNHFGESLLVVGRESDHVARARLGFQVGTRSQRDSLANGVHLRLSAIPLANVVGSRFLRESVQGRDSLALLVETFAWNGSGQAYRDTLNAYHRRALFQPVPFSTFPLAHRVRDTIRVAPSAAYPDSGIAQDSSQAFALPNLHERLRTDTTSNWMIYLELSPLTESDSGLFRFDLRAIGLRDADRRRYATGLWLGRHNPDSLGSVGTLLVPYRSGFANTPATNYSVEFTGASTRSLLYGVSRGVHLRLNRGRLLDSIEARLQGMGVSLPSAPSGEFDRRFFVPYAAIRLPLADSLARVDGPYALDMQLRSDIDSLDRDDAGFGSIGLALDDSLRLPVLGGGTYASVPLDTLLATYRAHPVDTALRQVLFRWARESSTADTFIVAPDERRRELTLRRRSGWLLPLTIGFTPSAENASLEVFFSAQQVNESRAILDSTGREITLHQQLTRRFWNPGGDSLRVRATRGMRTLLNRNAGPGAPVVPDLFLRGVERAAFDTTTVGGISHRRVSYPVFGEIDFPRENDTLRVGLEVYLFPLESAQ